MTTFIVAAPLRLTAAATAVMSADVSLVTGPPAATSFALSGPTGGTTGSPVIYTVTPNGVMSATVVVTPAATNGGSVSPSTLTFASGSSAAQTFTVTRAADGTSSVSITNAGGLGITGSPISLATSGGSAGTTLAADYAFRSTGALFATNFPTQASVLNNVWGTPDPHVSWDPIIARSGGSARFTRQTDDGTAAGQLRLRFDGGSGSNTSQSSAVSIGANTEFWVQWMVYTNEAALRWLHQAPAGNAGASFKTLWVSGGGTHSATSQELVVINRDSRMFPSIYGNIGAYDLTQSATTPNFGSSNFRFTNAIDAGTPASPTTDSQYAQRFGALYRNATPGLLASNLGAGPDLAIGVDAFAQNYPDANVVTSGVPHFQPDGWICLEAHVILGPDTGTSWTGCTLELYAGQPGPASNRVLVQSSTRPGPYQTWTGVIPHETTTGETGYGAFWPAYYITNAVANSPNVPPSFMCVGELIVKLGSTRIPWPAVPAFQPSWKTTLVDTQPAGTWVAIPNTNLATVTNAAGPSGITGNGAKGKIAAWCSLAWDYQSCRAYTNANGGHGDWPGNETDMLDLLADTPGWANLRPFSEVIQVDVTHYPDGRPTSRHTYYGIFYNQLRRRVMDFGGAQWGANLIKTVDGFDPVARDWDPAFTFPSIPTNFGLQHGSAMCRDPKNDDIYVFDNFSVARWNSNASPGVTANTWSMLVNNTGSKAWNNAASAMDTKRRRVLLIGGNQSARHSYDLATPTVDPSSIPITFTGPAAAAVLSSGAASLCYLPDRDFFVLMDGKVAGGVIHKLEWTGTNTINCTTVATTGGSSIQADPNGSFNRFTYLPKLGLCAYYPTYGENMRVIRIP